MNCSTNELLIIRTIRWSQTIAIEVKPSRCRGSRARLVSPSEPDQPIFLKRNLLIPSCALQGPSVSSLIDRSTSPCLPGEQRSIARLATHQRTTGSCRSSKASRCQYSQVSPRRCSIPMNLIGRSSANANVFLANLFRLNFLPICSCCFSLKE